MKNDRLSLRHTAAALGLTAALVLTVPGTASGATDPSCTAQQRADYPGLCGVIESTVTPAPSSDGSGGGGIGDWFSDFASANAGLIVGAFVIIIVGLIAVGLVRDSAEQKEERSRRAAAEAARGRALAEQWHAEQVLRAHAEAAAQMPDRSVYDPMNMGVAPAPVDVPPVPAPPTDPEDLQRYATFGAALPWTPGTAFAAVAARNGDWSRARGTWARACEQAGLVETDDEGAVTLQAELTGLRTIGGDDDAVVLAIRPAGLHVAEKQLDRVREFLVVTAHVETASPFVREASSGLYLTTLRNAVEQAPAPAPEAAPVNDPSQWEW